METTVPPQLASYHFHDAPVPKLPPLTARDIISPSQTVFAATFDVMEAGAVDGWLTLMVMLAHVAPVTHPPSPLT